ncbi:MAG: transposase [Cenarchaeum sp. SB0665_bin_23]|nr:transposase [Cenarchaeum sp. SB0667_bin_13]MXY37875.1 transposase [Cenarchaeum sp. SB0664_bin_35]MXY60711.1 transposase [Cenarchaeum sp. SB0665_bin_23]MXZ93185.1 transposase [Cenarchaeum sp. SB0666_bin_15]MYB46905.1 transposase [Cenarchaeum sp. SB0662_bin_33]MYC79825.1 transposase [Cenarchaeum sp. SB0661_bin_35]MYD58511.1 transposase [Cenarchaeum sp. SB0678_bin_8]MYG33016.1 transposase [Cenarchaeum sp. SB0677_bin_16]MYI52125.1 transposase [Cenarchaeum sp. SB0673_bin_9]MYJ28118.1 transpo
MAQRCERESIPLYEVAAKYTSQTCHTMDVKSRVSRDELICTRTFHADVSAA